MSEVIHYLVERVYRGKRRVVCLTPARSEAETALRKQVEALRDGDVVLYECKLTKLEGHSGGYNRTRW